MELRKLKREDASLMYEWMKDDAVVKYLNRDFKSYSKDDAVSFINESENESNNYHRAIVSDSGEYMGTVSLKNIDNNNGNAELAIVVRSSAMRKGYSWFAMTEILKIAFEKMELSVVYWCVHKNDARTCRFYDKHGFHQVIDVPPEIKKRYYNYDDLIWYSVLEGDDYLNEALLRGEVAGCRVVNVKTIPTVNAGELSFFEGNNHDLSFDIKRIYYISKVPEGVRRGFHAHKELKQFLFCPYGKIQLILENEVGKEEITLSDPSIGVIIERPTWREMLWLEKDSVLCVAASDFYKVDDYIRDYDEFKTFVKK